VLAALDAACAARLVAETDGPPAGYRFVHALVRHTVSDGLGAARRMQLHRATGAALAAVTGDRWREHAADLARHWLAATPPAGAGAEEVGRTLDYAQEAAGRAAALAYEEGAAILGRSVPLLRQLDDPARRAELLVSLGEAQHHAGEAAHRATLREAAGLALDLRLGVLAERAVLANLRPVNVLLVLDPERVALLEALLDCLGPGDTGGRARVLAALASELHHTADPRRHDLAREAITVARRLDDPVCLARVLAMAGFCLWEPETLAERVAIAGELNALAEPLGEPATHIDAGLALYYAAAQDGDFDRARAGLEAATRLADDLGQPALRLRALLGQQSCAMLDGRFADFKRHAAAAVLFGESLGNPDAIGILHIDGAVARLLLGRVDEAIEGFAAGLSTVAMPTCLANPFLSWAYTEVAGRSRPAPCSLRSAARRWTRSPGTTYGWACSPSWPEPQVRSVIATCPLRCTRSCSRSVTSWRWPRSARWGRSRTTWARSPRYWGGCRRPTLTCVTRPNWRSAPGPAACWCGPGWSGPACHSLAATAQAPQHWRGRRRSWPPNLMRRNWPCRRPRSGTA
jgi:hypothetical protein